jgi:isoquinoline 1-oxidoreductase alpha subunit
MQLQINGTAHEVDADPQMPLLWVLRDLLDLTGTKFGCGIGACRSCTVHLDGAPTPASQVPVSAAVGKAVTTIEALADDALGARLQAAWLAHQVPQCGYCQPGWLMSATALLADTPRPTDDEIDRALDGHICRCGTYNRIRAAIRSVADGGAK